jgi:menaquinone-dependent protoporphyrinogen oxidase
MTQALVLYASTHGHTAKIAVRVAEALERAGVVIDLRRADSKIDIAPSDYDAVVVGASIHAGHHQREIVDWVRRHAATLSTMPSAFFSVSLSAADDDAAARAAARKYVDDFVEETGWTPGRTESFAGAVQYREYDFFTRLLIKLMMHRGGHPTDTSRDYDYTDWDAVERFGEQCAALLPVTAS